LGSLQGCHQLVILFTLSPFITPFFLVEKMTCFTQKKKGLKPFSMYLLYLKILPRGNSKLCFELLEMLSAAQTTCPCAGG